jgi:AraC-like DNA-binding protein
MKNHLRHDSAPDLLPDLPRLDVAIRLKAELIDNISASPPRQWPQHLANFVTALAESGLQDKTAVLVLLAEVRQELRAFASLSKSGEGDGESDIVQLFDAESSSDPSVHQILARFQHLVANDLQVAAGSLIMPDVVMRAMRFIEAHYAEPITVARIAAAAGRSRKHLGTLFRQHGGTTVHEYLIRVRLRHALHLIRNGEKIEAVSLQVGYRSKKNFYQHFKSHTGITPMAYRTQGQ